MFGTLLSLATADPQKHRANSGDTSADRLSSVATFYTLIGLAVVVQFIQLVGDPVQCLCPAHFTSSHVDFANSVCWTSNTYHLPIDERIPKDDQDKEYVSYYQWVAIMLVFQGLLFHLPRPLWRSLSAKAGISPSTIIDCAMEAQMKRSTEERDQSVSYMVNHMARFLMKLRNNPGCMSVLRGHYLVLTCTFIKTLYFVNVVGQLYLLNAFLDTDFNLYGFEILRKMLKQEPWLNSSRFPKVTLCDVHIRRLGNVQRYTLQCSIPRNLFNEIIYILVWFLFVFVAAATVVGLLFHLAFVIIPRTRSGFIKKRLVSMGKIHTNCTSKETANLRKFVTHYLKADGCFIVQLVSKNASDLVAADLICGLWNMFLSENAMKLTLGDISSRLRKADPDLEEGEGEDADPEKGELGPRSAHLGALGSGVGAGTSPNTMRLNWGRAVKEIRASSRGYELLHRPPAAATEKPAKSQDS